MTILYARNEQGVTLVYRGDSDKQVRARFNSEYSRKGWTIEIVEE